MSRTYGRLVSAALLSLFAMNAMPAFSQKLPEAAIWAGFSKSTGKTLGVFEAVSLSGARLDSSIASGVPVLFHVWSAAKDSSGDGPTLVAALRKALPDAAIMLVSAEPAARVSGPVAKAGLEKAAAASDAMSLIRALGSPSAPAWIFVGAGGEIVAYRLGRLEGGVDAVKALFATYAPKAAATSPAATPSAPPAGSPPSSTAASASTATASGAAAAAPAAAPAGGIALNAGVADEGFAHAIELEIAAELNLARTEPKRYADVLKEYRKLIRGTYLERPGQITVVLNEGAKAVDEAIAFLEKQKPLPPLSLSKGLSLAAKDHAKDQGKTGQTGHTGSDGSTMGKRIERYGSWQFTAGENIAYGGETARDVVIQLVVDDGVASRGHRANIFNGKFLVVGIAFGPHAGYRTVCVQDFAGGYTER